MNDNPCTCDWNGEASFPHRPWCGSPEAELIAQRRTDDEFMERLRQRVAEDAPILERLADDYYCGGSKDDIGSFHEAHWSPQSDETAKWCHGDPRKGESKVTQVNRLLGIDIWSVRSFRANVQIDFDEFGNVLSAQVLNAEEKP